MPGTDGGSITKHEGIVDLRELAAQVAEIASAVSPLRTRSSNGFSGTKITPALGALVKVAPSKPAKATECCARPAAPG